MKITADFKQSVNQTVKVVSESGWAGRRTHSRHFRSTRLNQMKNNPFQNERHGAGWLHFGGTRFLPFDGYFAGSASLLRIKYGTEERIIIRTPYYTGCSPLHRSKMKKNAISTKSIRHFPSPLGIISIIF